MTTATERLRAYNGNAYDAATNPYGLDGIGGMDANLVQAFNDMGEVGASATSQTAALSVALFTWDTGTASADPGSGKIRATSVTITTGSFTLCASDTDSGGNVIGALLDTLFASTSAVKSRARLVNTADATKYIDVQVTGGADAGAYHTLSVTVLAGPGGFASGDALALGWVRTGDKGDTGPTGGVSTVFGRSGAVTAQSGDYTASQVGALPTSGGTLSGAVNFSGYAAQSATLYDTRYTRVDKGTVSSGTVTFDVSASNWQRLQVGGSLTIALSNWPSSVGASLLLEIVNGGAGTITWPTISFVKSDGTTQASPTRSLQSSGTDFIQLWRNGTTVYGKVI
ncbi:hypothetical protein [Azospirillum sp.]|uniref:hypothetical protein n=1 Tax=Azospirillum sp. TaxID=34012 RepID=UPI003D714FFF